jgi:hypothetical protein
MNNTCKSEGLWLRGPGVVVAAAMLGILLSGCISPRPVVAPGVTTSPVVCASATNAPDRYTLDLGVLASADTDLAGSRRTRALGPFFETRAAPDGRRFFAVRPFYSRAEGPDKGRIIHEVLWPVASVKDFEDERFWRFLVLYGHDFERHKAGSRYRLLLLPFLFAGRNAEGGKYFALFPLGGRIDEFLTRDRINFALFPLYSYSTINGQRTHSVLWPVGSYTKGEGVSRLRVFPLYGHSTYKDQWKKTFALWPLWSTVEYSYPNSKGGGFVLFPLVGHVKLTDQETWMLFPPFLRWSKGAIRSKLNAPWPFIQYMKGDSDRLYVWPLWGRSRQAQTRMWFCAWPLISGQETQYKDSVLNRFRVLPLIQYESRTSLPGAAAPTNCVERLPEPAALERYFKLWPLLSYARQGTNKWFSMISPWPLRDAPSIEKNWAPFWTLYSCRKAGAAGEHELLWGLYRQAGDGTQLRHLSLFPLVTLDRGAAGSSSRRVSLLLNLVHYERNGLDTGWRLLYLFKFGSLYREPANRPGKQP